MPTLPDPNEQERRIEAMAAGREAVAMMGMLRPYIDSRVANLVHLMAASYRNRSADFPLLLGVAAQVTCLMDLLSDLDNRAKRGDQAMQKELTDGSR